MFIVAKVLGLRVKAIGLVIGLRVVGSKLAISQNPLTINKINSD
jgi:hypothetical protein